MSVQRRAPFFVDQRLNYGRREIAEFLSAIAPFQTVLDVGSGHGDDLLSAARAVPQARLVALENNPTYARELELRGMDVHRVNIESDRFPVDDESVDVVVANQVMEHVK